MPPTSDNPDRDNTLPDIAQQAIRAVLDLVRWDQEQTDERRT